MTLPTSFLKDYQKITTRITKCKYCGRKYIHTIGGPVVTIQKLDMNAFKPELKFVHHDARLPLKCDSCGADVILNIEIIIPKTLKTDRESLYI